MTQPHVNEPYVAYALMAVIALAPMAAVISRGRVGRIAFAITKFQIGACLLMMYWVPRQTLTYLGVLAGFALLGLLVKRLYMRVASMIAGGAAVTRTTSAKRSHAPLPEPSDAQEHAGVRTLARPPKLTFAHVVGMDDVKARLLEAGKAVIESRRGKSPDDLRNGIMLSGPPGTGKTTFAEALAGELRLAFLPVNIGSIASRWVNQTTEQLKQVFDDARVQAPCVLFLDEFESLAPNRANTNSSDSEAARQTNALLAELTGIRDAGVLVVAATNHLDRCDEAAVREGRFDFKIQVPLPDLKARSHLLGSTLAKQKVRVDADAIARAAGRWAGFSSARLVAVAKEASISARKTGQPVDFAALMCALRTVQGNDVRAPEGTASLADLIMAPRQKRALSMIAHRLRNIEEIEAQGGTLPGGILFSGPPGTGKTATARALAKEAGWALIATTGMALMSDKDAFAALVAKARDLRPAIVFIDEADDVLADRRMSNVAPITNTILTQMDGATGRASDVLFIAATNNPDLLDEAALRGGRFSEKVAFELPGTAEVAQFAAKWLDTTNSRFSSDVTAAWLGERFAGISLATVTAVLQQAINIAVADPDRRDKVANQEDIELGASMVL